MSENEIINKYKKLHEAARQLTFSLDSEAVIHALSDEGLERLQAFVDVLAELEPAD